MFQFNSIFLCNFKSFVGDHDFVFPTVPGLYNLTGANQQNPRLGANGAGKSSFLDAVTWCLYGRTPRGLKAIDVVTWGQRTCVVTLTLTIADEQHIVSRSQNPNRLLLDSTLIDQAALNDVLRLNAESFLRAVVFPQFGDKFLDLKPADKLAVFSDILGLDFWVEKSKEAKKLCEAINADISYQNGLITGESSRLEVIKADIATLTDQDAAFEADQAKIIVQLEEAMRAKMTEGATLSKDVKRVENLLVTFEEKLAKFATERAKKENEREATIRQKLKFTTEIEFLTKQVAGLSKVGAQCPTCHQRVDNDHLKGKKSLLKGQIVGLTAKIDMLPTVETVLVSEDEKSVLTNRADFERKLNNTINQIAYLKRAIDELKQKITDETGRKSPYRKLLEGKKAELKSVAADIVKAKALVTSLEQEVVAVEFWVNGFKRLRLFLVDEALQSLGIEVNNALTALGLSDWIIGFDVERENKSGGITKGFVTQVLVPKMTGTVRYEAWSGGETQRLRLAGDLGLANLIMDRAGLKNTIEFFDEPSQHLSQEGLLDLAEALQQRAEDSGKVIFLVDHHTLDFGGFTDTITLVKDADGSHFE